jgi:hypothetical protein
MGLDGGEAKRREKEELMADLSVTRKENCVKSVEMESSAEFRALKTLLSADYDYF